MTPVAVVLGLEYDGGRFHGFQSQRGLATVQDALEDAIARVADSRVRVTAAGRTDAGVHATQQVVSFDTTAERSTEGWRRGITSLTPDGLGATWCAIARPGFSARFDARWRRYIYVFGDGEAPVIGRGQIAWAGGVLDDVAMHRAAQPLVGEHDFSAFRAAGCQSRSPRRRVHALGVTRRGGYVAIDICANAFVLRMVRNIAGALLAVGRGVLDADAPEALLAGRDRTRAPPTAPAEGLYLVDVGYRDIATRPRLPPVLAAAGP